MPAKNLPPLSSQAVGASGKVYSSQNHLQVLGKSQGRLKDTEPRSDCPSNSSHELYLPDIHQTENMKALGNGIEKDRESSVLSPDTALRMFSRQMSTHEKDEIFEYPCIYFLGTNAQKRSGVEANGRNGYDDESGSYIQVLTTSSSTCLLLLTFIANKLFSNNCMQGVVIVLGALCR